MNKLKYIGSIIKQQKITFNLLILSVLFFSFSCNNDNDFFEEELIQTDALEEDLYGAWSIYKVEHNGNESNVPPSIEECGRDFFIYTPDFYEEFLFQESAKCLPTQNKLNWNLKSGIITLSDNINSEVLKIKNLNEDSFVFIVELDLNGDNVKEEYTFTALKYLPPNETDIYSLSFQRKDAEPFENHIEFGWDKYVGYNKFDRYEIYRSGKDCNLNNAELIETITDINTNTFIENDPPHEKEFCYFFKIYTDKGLLGESDPRYINTEFIYPENVIFENAEVNNNSINLSWEKYSGYYFSHYEIRVQDQNENSSPNIETVKIITDINTVTFIDENPPFVHNPIYTIYAYNVFGNISNLNDARSSIETDFIRPEILEITDLKFLSFDEEDQSFFIYGRTKDRVNRLIKYSYLENKVIAEAFKMPTTHTEVEMKLITSENGKELLFHQGSEIAVYDATTLNFKYNLKPDFFSTDSFSYLTNNIWVFCNRDNVFTCKRDNDKLQEINIKPHFSDHQGSMKYQITRLDKNNILLSHNNEGRAIYYNVSDEGEIINKGIKEVPLKFKYNSDVIVKNNLILNKMRNTIYTVDDFSIIDNYSIPKTTLNFNQLGTKVYGTNNVETFLNFAEDYEKNIIIYNIGDKTTNTITTNGYSSFVIEDKQGKIISLSSSFPSTSSYGYMIYDSPSIFIEILD